ncbi:hypothetical protein [Pontibacter fetidus]|uniref:Uncharacterized protein n=1 Tax=Pontibacter fetidus TaxID=2700082 RepID=A0A6B2GX01_9BACT|nr:hypothetical protein [Pontibacter fetidus]NDK55365.1 hypothetical protein [Pontibacter fetidus]
MKNGLEAYYAELTAALPSLYTPEAFHDNQALPLIADEESFSLSKQITYYVQELDKLETVPVKLLQFCGYEPIDGEHYFFFYKVNSEKQYDKLNASQRVLRAVIALVPIQGFLRLLVQHVEAIAESCFLNEHQPITNRWQAMAG